LQDGLAATFHNDHDENPKDTSRTGTPGWKNRKPLIPGGSPDAGFSGLHCGFASHRRMTGTGRQLNQYETIPRLTLVAIAGLLRHRGIR